MKIFIDLSVVRSSAMKPMFSANTEAIRREILVSDQVGAALTLFFFFLNKKVTNKAGSWGSLELLSLCRRIIKH